MIVAVLGGQHSSCLGPVLTRNTHLPTLCFALTKCLGFTEVGTLGGSEVTFSVCQGSTTLKDKGLWLHLLPTRTRLVVRAPGDHS